MNRIYRKKSDAQESGKKNLLIDSIVRNRMCIFLEPSAAAGRFISPVTRGQGKTD
jgi:hypothetical protein